MAEFDPKDKKILLIEDDVFVRDLYVRTLEMHGYQLDVANDGQAGVEKATASNHDLILLDIMMPKKNGIEVVQELKKDNDTKETPIILLSNLGQESIIEEAFKMGIDGYMLKARYVPDQIAEIIAQFFETGTIPEDLTKI